MAPPIDRVQLLRLAELARLHLPAERQGPVLLQLQRIVEAFDALRTLPAAAPSDAESQSPLRLRPDVAEPAMPMEQVLANAPQSAGGMFVVPRVVDA